MELHESIHAQAATIGAVESDLPAWCGKIRKAVERHGQLKALAVQARMTSPQLQKIAYGLNRNPRIETLSRIAEAMGITLEELVSNSRPEKADHGDIQGQGSAFLERVLQTLDDEAPAEDSWRGDVLKAVAALNRALRRADQRPGAASNG